MTGEASFTITLRNNATEKEALRYVRGEDPRFLIPDRMGRASILAMLGLPASYSRAFDMVLAPGHTSVETAITLSDGESITLVEVKATRKRLTNLPYGFFFGATKNEFDLAKALGHRFAFCFVCLHAETKGYRVVGMPELEPLIRTRRIQYQVNLLSGPSKRAD